MGWLSDYAKAKSIEVDMKPINLRRTIVAELWKPQTRIVYREWIDAITTEASDKLNDWENDFIDKMADYLFHHDLSENQAKKLEEIYVKYTS